MSESSVAVMQTSLHIVVFIQPRSYLLLRALEMSRSTGSPRPSSSRPTDHDGRTHPWIGSEERRRRSARAADFRSGRHSHSRPKQRMGRSSCPGSIQHHPHVVLRKGSNGGGSLMLSELAYAGRHDFMSRTLDGSISSAPSSFPCAVEHVSWYPRKALQ